MTDTAARLAISARRNEVARFTIAVAGIDLTGVAMTMPIRHGRDVPGVPLINLATVTTTAAEGLKLDSVIWKDGVPTSVIKGRINASTMSDAAKVPYSGEIGEDTTLQYAMTWALNGDTQVRLYGDFVVLSSAYGSDGAPVDRPPSYGGSASRSGGSALTGALQFGDQVVQVTISGADIVSLFAARADTAAGRAETAAAALIAGAQLGDVTVTQLIDGSPDKLRVDVPTAANGARFDVLFTATNTGAAMLTAGGITRQIARDPGGADTQAGDLPRGQIGTFSYSAGGGKFVLLAKRPLGSRLEGVDDPALGQRPWGDVSFASDGTRKVAPIERYVVVAGSSNAHPDYVPAAQLPANVAAAALNEFLPGDGVLVKAETVAQPGAPMVTLGDQLSKSASMGAGTARWVLTMYGMNDARTLFYHSQGGITAQITALRAQVAAIRAAGAEPVLNTIFPPDPRRSDVALDPLWFASTAGFPGGGAGQSMDYPAYKAGPVDPETQMVPSASNALTLPKDWTGRGIKRVGYSRIWDVNRRVRRLAAELGCVLLDFHAAAYRLLFETTADRGPGLDPFYNRDDPLHPRPAFYELVVSTVIREWAQAVAEGRSDRRIFGGEAQRFIDFDFTAGDTRGAAIARAAGPSTYRGPLGALVKSVAVDTVRFDYDPPVENRFPRSDGSSFWGAISNTQAITVTQQGDVTKHVVGPVGSNEYALHRFGEPAQSGPQTMAVDIRGEVGGEVVYLMADTGTKVTYRRFVLTVGWQRLDLTGPGAAIVWDIGNNNLYPEFAEAVPAQTYYIRRRQLNRGPVALAYVETTGTPIYQPAVCRGVMLEPERTNYLVQSDAISSSSPYQTEGSVQFTEGMASLTGGKSARVAFNGDSSLLNRPNSVTSVAAGDIWQTSIFARSPDATSINVGLNGFTNGGNNRSAERAIGGGWTRLSIGIATVADTGLYAFVGTRAYSGGAALGARTVDLHGLQLEIGAQPSSYIPTTTTAATRPAETLRLSVDATATGEVDLYYADGSFETRTGTLAGGVLSLPASDTPRIVSKARARRAA